MSTLTPVSRLLPEPKRYKERFFDALLTFLDELAQQFPKDDLIQTASLAVRFTPPTLVIAQFIDHILPYKDHIANQDTQYFLHTDFTHHYRADERNITKDEFQFHMDYFKVLWEDSASIPADTRRSIWMHMTKLVALCDKYLKAVQLKKEHEVTDSL